MSGPTEGSSGLIRGVAVIAVLTLGAGAALYRQGVPAAAPAVQVSTRPAGLMLPGEPLLGFVQIPGGAFQMGSDRIADPLAFDNEWAPASPTRQTVAVPTFYIGRYEVTVAQYAAFVAATGHRVVDPQALAGAPDEPVASVAWTDAVAYARWLDGALRASPATPAPLAALLNDGWRVALPSEAEWEKAARGTDGRTFPWGDELRRDLANFGSGSVVRVGSRACETCAHGLADMAGNVWEWTRSPFQPYPYDGSDDARDLESDALWVMRGGSFLEPERYVRTAARGAADPGARRPFIGFRVVITRG